MLTLVMVAIVIGLQAAGQSGVAQTRVVVPSSLSDVYEVCDEADRCVSIGVLRELLAERHSDAETLAERLARENVNLQEQLARTLAQVADLDAQLGPLRAREHAAQIRQQREALKATAEQARPGYLYDPVTGTRTKKLTPQSPK